MTDETADNMDTTAAQSGEKRPVGRPKGLPKTGGRPRGAKNRLPAEFRKYIDQRGRPLELLAAISRGNKVTAANPDNPSEKVRVYPSLGERTTAARALLDRLLPALKATEMSGPDGGPVPFQGHMHGLEDQDAEVIRRVLFLAETARRADAPAETVEGWASPGERNVTPAQHLSEPAEPETPEPEPLPVGHQEDVGSYTLRLCERFGDGRERWAASNGDGQTVAVAFSRDRLVELIEEGEADAAS